MNNTLTNNTLLVILKFVLAVLLLPFVWATSVSFHKYVVALPGTYGDFFFWGMFGFLLCFLFFYQFWGVYEFGQKITSGIFKFMVPADNFIAKIIPFYLTVILLLHFITTKFFNVNDYGHYFMYFAGFAFTMHVLLTAQDLQQQEHAFIKPAYLFVITTTLVLMICVVVLLFDLLLGEFLFLAFIKSAVSDALGIYYAAGERIMSPK